MRWPTLSIRNTVLGAIALGVVLPAAVVLVIDDRLAREAHAPLVERHRVAVLQLGAAALAEPVWTVSAEHTRAAVEQLLREPSVCAVALRELRQGQGTLALDERKCNAAQPVQQREAAVLHDGRPIAQLTMAFDDSQTDRLLADRRRSVLWMVLAQVVAGVVVLLGVLSLRLLGPIARLKTQASAIAARTPAPPLEWRRRDELGQLGQHLNEVRGRIDELFGELERKNGQLRKLAMHDHLTGLPNRTLFRELFQHELARSRRGRRPFALLFVDLDQFKTVNDVMGHAAGDELLLGTSQRLLATLRESDVVCRMGGDEFLVLLPGNDGADEGQVAATAERLLRAIETPLPLQRAGQTAQVSASIGIALYPRDGEDFDTLARHADLAMYRSKELGRSRHSFFQADLNERFLARVRLERELTHAIAHGELVLHFQPVVDAAAPLRRVASVEALVRWQHPQRGLLLPGEFITLAEESGLIRELGLWTLEAACAQLAQWKLRGRRPDRVAVNVSALQFRDERLLDALAGALKRHGVAPGEIELELTEGTLLADTDSAQRTVARLRELGVTLVIDDFGTGYSSLSYLKRLRPDKLKIDRSFVRDLPDDADDRTLTEAIVGMAHALAIEVVAEGVETAAQRDFLLGLGCRLQQGYLVAKPLPAAQVEAMFERPVSA